MNGSLTREFQFHRGVKQGDPLSPLLFILIMESLHILVQRVVDRGMFRGISMGLSLHFSHLLDADDAVFMGILVANVIVDRAAAQIDCATLEALLSYLVLKINASKVVLRFDAHLSYVIVQSSHEGSLENGIYSLSFFSMMLIKKWVWCFRTQGSSLWARVIEGIHGEDGKLGKNVNHNHPFIWLDIVREMKQLKNHDTNLIGFIHKKMGNGADASFWEDVWRGIEQLQFLEFLASIEGVALIDMRDMWVWSLEGSREFSVAYV
uniref:RNA-directed DNA polymerase, eukaryota, reverse transcriptase zinc-binding domain protein n=1 Tax=Tanacetum cinerariifolium TaxID=118510 RepID=A0A699JVC3_TANCI|nr:RNA-directed DNA polymerase, eukaryota, reverse transcriptase zinc-binding domain protein [Tanacetum cinerariifolium]